MHGIESQSKPQPQLAQKPGLHDEWINHHAWQIVKTLQNSGFETYLVGGCVRDLLAGIHPKDFDIATSALPQEVRRKVSNAYVIGRRFKLVLVKRDDQQFEIATFRRNALPEELEAIEYAHENPEEASTGPASPTADNFFGTVAEDAQRRDFTVNALFYDPVRKELIDHCAGLVDVQQRWIRMIGEPVARLKEDSIRILRAVRLAHKLNFSIAPDLRAGIAATAAELATSALPRRREEWLKILRLNDPYQCFVELHDLGVTAACLPALEEIFLDEEKSSRFRFLMDEFRALTIDRQNPLELFAAFAYVVLLSQLSDRPIDAAQSQRLELFAKEEIGMFKLEYSSLLNSLQLIEGLKTPEIYLRKGERRQSAFMKQEGLYLGYELSRLSFDLTPQQRVFWLAQAEKWKA